MTIKHYAARRATGQIVVIGLADEQLASILGDWLDRSEARTVAQNLQHEKALHDAAARHKPPRKWFAK